MLSLLFALAAQGAEPPVVRSEATERTLTVYRDDLAFITETHRLNLPAGRVTVVLEGVNDQMVPQTASLRGYDGAELERNFTEDLLSKQTFYESLLGQRVILTRTDPNSGEVERLPAEVVSAGQGVVLRTEAGVETLDCTGLDAALSSDRSPEGLVAEPELSLMLDAEGGPASLTVSYLAREIGWSADYVLTVDEEADRAALRAWLTVTNETADAFERVPAAVVAGSLRIDDDTEAPGAYAPRYAGYCYPRFVRTRDLPERRADNPYLLGFPDDRARYLARRSAPSPVMAMQAESLDAASDEIVVTGARARTATEERFGDYRLYRPPAPVTVAPYQTKQIAFLDEGEVPYTKRYRFVPTGFYGATPDASLAATILYDLDNTRETGLARALPQGTARVMTARGGELFYLGQDDIEDRAVGLPVEIEAGTTRGVQGYLTSETLSTARLSSGEERRVVRLTLEIENGTPREATADLSLEAWVSTFGTVEVVRATAEAVPDKNVPTYRLAVPPGEARQVVLTLNAPG